jgi:hypothetical protein
LEADGLDADGLKWTKASQQASKHSMARPMPIKVFFLSLAMARSVTVWIEWSDRETFK